MRKLVVVGIVFVGLGAGAQLTAGCGSDSEAITGGGGADGATDAPSSIADGGGGGAFIDAIVDGSRGATTECKITGQSCTGSADCCTANCVESVCAPPLGNSCKLPDAACATGNECCTGSCVGGTCSSVQCAADNAPCGADTDCCGGTCAPDGTGGGACRPLNPSCRTSGNPCASANDCCSKLCNGGLCSGAVSFCTQQNEICSSNSQCCTGNCVLGSNGVGTCGGVLGGGASGCSPSGTVCALGAAAEADGGVCEQSCCSRSCGPYGGLSGFRVCQPPSGCRPTGEVCRDSKDCCGNEDSPDPKKGFVTCDKPDGAEFGRCNNGGACREPGSICKVGGPLSCSAENNCCETIGTPNSNCNSHPEECCAQDALGIPRCLVHYVGDCSTPVAAGTTCATSADCCGSPCVDNKCGAAGACVPTGGACTTNADCCAGVTCAAAPGSSSGICGGTVTADGGVIDAGATVDAGSCALYGQICGDSTDCCSNVPCTKAIGAEKGTCRYP